MFRPSQKFDLQLSAPVAFAALALVLLLPGAQAQTYQVIHDFTDEQDGATPLVGLTMDRSGNLYGTASSGGYFGGNCYSAGCGTVFKLAPRGSGWVFTPLYLFQGTDDGQMPYARVVFGPDGRLYGSTDEGGNPCYGAGCGTVFSLAPPAPACKSVLCPWTETVLYRFSGPDGAHPQGDLIFDRAGNIYGTTVAGGNTSCSGGIGGTCGTVFKLTPSNGGWTESVAYAFTGDNDGFEPRGGVILDGAGNLYGTTAQGGPPQGGGLPNGTVFELTPSGSGWSKSILFTFELYGDGVGPVGLVFDGSGDLYGATPGGGANKGGAVYELIPSNPGNWTFEGIYSFQPEGGPEAALTLDAAGNLYGTQIEGGGSGHGAAFKLTPSDSGWTYSSLHDFTLGSDGGYPSGSIIFDANGNIYSTTQSGGIGPCNYGYGCGVVFEITP